MDLTDSYSKEFLKKIEALNKVKPGSFSLDLLRKALLFAKRKHDGQFRESGEIYYSHPLQVAKILLNHTEDIDVIIASILHDVVEDTETDLLVIEFIFGKNVAHLVDSVTKIDSLTGRKLSKDSVFTKITDSKKAVMIKMADRIHNIITLKFVQKSKSDRILGETLEFYIPLAKDLELFEMADLLEKEVLKYKKLIY